MQSDSVEGVLFVETRAGVAITKSLSPIAQGSEPTDSDKSGKNGVLVDIQHQSLLNIATRMSLLALSDPPLGQKCSVIAHVIMHFAGGS
jgi:hypothetical protein